MTDSKVEFLYLNEEDMLKAGVLDAGTLCGYYGRSCQSAE